MPSTTVYPNGDGTKTGWTGTGDTTNLYANVDAGTVTPTDADFNSASSNVPIYFLLGNMPGDFYAATAVTIRVRCNVTALKDNNRQFSTASIVKSDESTALTGDGNIASATATITTLSVSPSITGDTDKTSWDGARIKIGALTGTSGSASIHEIQVEITYDTAPAGGATKQFIHYQQMRG